MSRTVRKGWAGLRSYFGHPVGNEKLASDDSSHSGGWESLQALRSHLAGRMVGFKRNAYSVRRGLSPLGQNDATFFETDLRYIFTIIPTAEGISATDYEVLNRASHNLLSFLNKIVNERFTLCSEPLWTHGSKIESHNTTLGKCYPRLRAVVSYIEASNDQFNLIAGEGPSLFVLPEGPARNIALKYVAQVKNTLELSTNGTWKEEAPQSSQLRTTDLPTQDPLSDRHRTPPKHTSIVVNTLFRDIQERNCGRAHQVRLKVPKDWRPGPETTLNMLLSCCVDECCWRQTEFVTSRGRINERRMDGICAAIQRAKERNGNIYLLVDRYGLSDISDEMPQIPSASKQVPAETLGELLDQKVLTPITSGDYGAKSVVKKLNSHDKAVLALSLAKCLLEFFNDDMEVASRSWNPDRIYFLKSTKSRRQERTLYIALEPSFQDEDGLPQDTIELGNPILLSFAKLLLEIKIGERITAQIDFEGTANLNTWAEMCKLLHQMEQHEGSNYLRAVKGCLYLHLHCNGVAMRQPQDPADDIILGDVIRNTIQEQIVREIELMVHPESSKRKRRDSVSELPLSKKLFISTPAPHSAARIEVPPLGDPPFDEPTSRTDFEIAIICAIPIEFNAIATIVDEFWDRDYGKAIGDTNNYTNARIGKFNVAILVLSEVGKVSAATACTRLQQSYPAVTLVLVSGICGGVPFPGDSKEILLGDVIISRHVVQYDLGRLYPNGFKTKDTVQDRFGRPPENVRNLLSLFDTDRGLRRLEELTSTYLQELQARAIQNGHQGRYEYPGALQDQLFQPGYEHQCHDPPHTSLLDAPEVSASTHIKFRRTLCNDAGCDTAQLVPRGRLQSRIKQETVGLAKEAQVPSIFVGTVGSGDTVMKSGEERDDIASTHGLLAFEMEGAGVWGRMPCLIIKGICDYADSHKNKDWQNFSAATAASVTKALLSSYTRPD
ncbi:hypothetical protein BJY00DRAFT_294461, partial [Aspergillus carlsbadensis]